VSIWSEAYGVREIMEWGNLVRRPDGSLFIQGDRSTYRRVTVPESAQTLSYRDTGQNKPVPSVGSRAGVPGWQDEARPYTLIPDRVVFRALWVERTYSVPGGQEVVLRSLRHADQMPGNPYIRTTRES